MTLAGSLAAVVGDQDLPVTMTKKKPGIKPITRLFGPSERQNQALGINFIKIS
jgi:hypothetical protein